MNNENILQIAHSVMKSVTEIRNGIYRGELYITNQKPAGIAYLDLTQELNVEDFTEYQETLLADDYYNHPGDLQWNYYLFLLKDQVDHETRNKIEKNDKYARKYVFDENQFKDFFKLETSSVNQQPINIVVEWKKELDDVGLNQVYTKASYTEAVDNFVKNVPVKLPPAQVATSAMQEKWKKINRLVLRNTYRKKPKVPRDFTFGAVNLFRGSNGVGKTSVLEAIELIVTGKTLRNDSALIPDSCIEAAVNDSMLTTEICTPSRIEKYRARDLAWYHSEYKSNNYTYVSFNRFNFFNTDAASNFSQSSKESDIKKALFSLILGPEYSYLSERVKGFADRIRPVNNKLEKELREAKQKEKQFTETIEKLNNSTSMEGLQKAIKSALQNIRMIEQLDPETDPGAILAFCNSLNVILTGIEKVMPGNIRSVQDLEKEKLSLEQKKQTFKDFTGELQIFSTDISSEKQKLEAATSAMQLLKDAGKYFEDKRSFEIRGLNEKIRSNETALKTITHLKNTLNSIDLTLYKSTDSLQKNIDNTTEILNNANNELQVTVRSITASLERLDKITGLITQIKELGKQFIEANEHADTCPLCDTPFDMQALSKRINAVTQNELQAPGALKDLLQKQETLKQIITNGEKTLNDLNTLRIGCDIIVDQANT